MVVKCQQLKVILCYYFYKLPGIGLAAGNKKPAQGGFGEVNMLNNPAQAKRHADFMQATEDLRYDGYFVADLGVAVGDKITIAYDTKKRWAIVMMTKLLTNRTHKIYFNWLSETPAGII